jgi:hypothetical protein
MTFQECMTILSALAAIVTWWLQYRHGGTLVAMQRNVNGRVDQLLKTIANEQRTLGVIEGRQQMSAATATLVEKTALAADRAVLPQVLAATAKLMATPPVQTPAPSPSPPATGA